MSEYSEAEIFPGVWKKGPSAREIKVTVAMAKLVNTAPGWLCRFYLNYDKQGNDVLLAETEH